MITKDLGILANIAQIVSVVFPILMGIYAFVRRMERKQLKQDTRSALFEQKLQGIETTLASQFGGNSGGIREAINNMGAKVDKIEDRVNAMATDLANLDGRFDQHIEEN